MEWTQQRISRQSLSTHYHLVRIFFSPFICTKSKVFDTVHAGTDAHGADRLVK